MVKAEEVLNMNYVDINGITYTYTEIISPTFRTYRKRNFFTYTTICPKNFRNVSSFWQTTSMCISLKVYIIRIVRPISKCIRNSISTKSYYRHIHIPTRQRGIHPMPATALGELQIVYTNSKKTNQPQSKPLRC